MSLRGNGVETIKKLASFVAKIQHIRVFHTDSMTEFGNGNTPFIAKVPFSFVSQDGASSFTRCISVLYFPISWLVALEGGAEDDLTVVNREEEEDDDPSITDLYSSSCLNR